MGVVNSVLITSTKLSTELVVDREGMSLGGGLIRYYLGLDIELRYKF